jgi:hypothetical protein
LLFIWQIKNLFCFEKSHSLRPERRSRAVLNNLSPLRAFDENFPQLALAIPSMEI